MSRLIDNVIRRLCTALSVGLLAGMSGCQKPVGVYVDSETVTDSLFDTGTLNTATDWTDSDSQTEPGTDDPDAGNFSDSDSEKSDNLSDSFVDGPLANPPAATKVQSDKYVGWIQAGSIPPYTVIQSREHQMHLQVDGPPALQKIKAQNAQGDSQ